MTSIYHAAVSPDGKNQCVIESDHDVVWAYLLALDTREVISDVPLCSLAPLKSVRHFKAEFAAGDTPPLVEEYSTAKAVVVDLTVERLSVRWSHDGSCVVISIDGDPFAMMRSEEKRGYSKATKMDGPWGRPWDQNIFLKAEANQPVQTTPGSGAPLRA